MCSCSKVPLSIMCVPVGYSLPRIPSVHSSVSDLSPARFPPLWRVFSCPGIPLCLAQVSEGTVHHPIACVCLCFQLQLLRSFLFRRVDRCVRLQLADRNATQPLSLLCLIHISHQRRWTSIQRLHMSAFSLSAHTTCVLHVYISDHVIPSRLRCI